MVQTFESPVKQNVKIHSYMTQFSRNNFKIECDVYLCAKQLNPNSSGQLAHCYTCSPTLNSLRLLAQNSTLDHFFIVFIRLNTGSSNKGTKYTKDNYKNMRSQSIYNFTNTQVILSHALDAC